MRGSGKKLRVTFIFTENAYPQRQQLIAKTLQLVRSRADEYREEHSKDRQWIELVSKYAESFITGSPGSTRLDETTKRLVRQWVNDARTETGLEPPKRSTKKKRK